MLSVYSGSGMDVNFSQSFPAPFGLARSRVTDFEFHQEQASPTSSSSPPPYLSSTVSLVEPMLQSNMLVAPVSSTITTTTPPPPPSALSTSPSTSLMYYDSSPFLSNTTTVVSSSGTTNVSVSSSPSLNDSWGCALSTELHHDSTFNHTFAPLPPLVSEPQSSQYLFSSNIPAYLPSPPPLPPQHQEHEKQLLYPSSSFGMRTCDPVLNFVSSHGHPPPPSYPYHGRSMYQAYNGLSSSQTPVVTSAIIASPSISASSQPSNNKRKRTQSASPMSSSRYSKLDRSASMSPSSYSDDTRQQSPSSKSPRHHHHHHRFGTSRPPPPPPPPLSDTTITTTIGSSPPLVEQGNTFTRYQSSMNMISSFPTKIDVSSNSSSKRYQCHICTKKFTRPSSLTTHIYSHTKEKPFQCPVEGCGRHFSVVSNLRRHAKIHANPSTSKH